MYALVVSIALCCVVQVAYSHPDFGISATIPTKSYVTRYTILGNDYFLRVDDYVMPSRQSNVDMLWEAVGLLQDIAREVNRLGPTLMDSITTVTNDGSGGQISATYSLIGIAQVNFEDYMNGTLIEQIHNIDTLLGGYMRDQLEDDFFHIQVELTSFFDSLTNLQNAVTAANNAAAGSPVSDALVSQFITPSLITDLSHSISLLVYRIPVLMYSISSALENLEQADQYYYGLKLDTDRVQDEIAATGTDFYNNALTYSTLVESVMNALIANYETSFTEATTAATNINLAALTTAINGMKTVRETKLNATLTSYVELYRARLLELSTLLPIDVNIVFNPGENPAAVLVGILIANGPYSRYCFWKYASVLHNILLMSNYASECYDREYDRLNLLQQALLIEIELISYNLEVVTPYTKVCDTLSATAPTSVSNCATQITGFLTNMINAFDAKLAKFVRLTDIELKASKQRLSVCWSVKVQKSMFMFQQILPDIVACGTNGPNV